MKNACLIFWETIAALAGIKNPKARAALVMKKWGPAIMSPENSKQIVADLAGKSFPEHLTGADTAKIFRLNSHVLFQ